MKKKLLLSSIVIILILALSVFAAKPTKAPKPGEFDDADFFTPDYNNGATDTFNAGESRTFNYDCHCNSNPSKGPCSGSIVLQMDSGSGFSDVQSDACSAENGQTCSSSYSTTFDTEGTYTFRVFCDETVGTDFTQPSDEYVALTVETSSCTDGETRLCALQSGVCEGSEETCTGGIWPGCDYSGISGYEANEATCDDLDNDCDGTADNVDGDGDGSSLCGGLGVVNELLIQGLDGDYGNIDIFAYNPSTSSYDTLWSTYIPGFTGSIPGGEIGDLTHDGINDFVIVRSDGTYAMELWTYNPGSYEWYQVWSDASAGTAFIGDIADFDDDGYEELLFESSATNTIEVWGNDVVGATSLSQEAVIRTCGALFHNAGGDLNGNGIPEIIFQCTGDNIEIWEWTGSSYGQIAAVVPPPSGGTNPIMLIDDMECNGDLNRDDLVDCVICGNSGTSHVLTYKNSSYAIEYSAPATGSISYTQTCSIGDINNDGYADWFDSSDLGNLRVFSYQGSHYEQIWASDDHGATPQIGGSFAGDADNDGKGEFLITYTPDYKVELWESDEIGATSFSNTFTWDPASHSSNMIVGNLNPYNDDSGIDCDDNDENRYPGAKEVCGNGVDEDCDGSDLECVCVDGDGDGYDLYDAVSCQTGDDCNDNDFFVNPGVDEVCDDGIDNNCNDEIDEGCVSTPYCGDGYCDGRALGEDCNLCPDDCWAGERGACCGDNKCDINKGESAAVCPVDCS